MYYYHEFQEDLKLLTQKVYPSVTKAAEALGVPRQNIYLWLPPERPKVVSEDVMRKVREEAAAYRASLKSSEGAEMNSSEIRKMGDVQLEEMAEKAQMMEFLIDNDCELVFSTIEKKWIIRGQGIATISHYSAFEALRKAMR